MLLGLGLIRLRCREWDMVKVSVLRFVLGVTVRITVKVSLFGLGCN